HGLFPILADPLLGTSLAAVAHSWADPSRSRPIQPTAVRSPGANPLKRSRPQEFFRELASASVPPWRRIDTYQRHLPATLTVEPAPAGCVERWHTGGTAGVARGTGDLSSKPGNQGRASPIFSRRVVTLKSKAVISKRRTPLQVQRPALTLSRV